MKRKTPARKNNRPQKVAEEKEKAELQPYRKIDLDILITAYNVHSVIKHTPQFTRGDEENDVTARKRLGDLIDEHVHNKAYFNKTLINAQKRRVDDKLKGIKWYMREDFLQENDGYNEIFI